MRSAGRAGRTNLRSQGVIEAGMSCEWQVAQWWDAGLLLSDTIATFLLQHFVVLFLQPSSLCFDFCVEIRNVLLHHLPEGVQGDGNLVMHVIDKDLPERKFTFADVRRCVLLNELCEHEIAQAIFFVNHRMEIYDLLI